ncbi:AMP-binding protein [Flavobacteriaceae bacterium]|nr:AMP-binding protein [Flavobacteriaceae bacterium]
MIFWIEEDTKVYYNQLIKDISRKESSYDFPGYKYFLFLIIDILNGSLIESIDDLINYIIDNKNQLTFTINTSGTTSTPKPVVIKMSNCIRYVKFYNNDKKRIWGMGYPAGSFASTQVFFQSIINKETIIYLFGIDFKSLDEVLTRHKISNLSCTPTFLSMLLIHLKNIYPSVKK